jgi:hypothetical protein
MINHRKKLFRLTVMALAVVGPISTARAQAGKPPPNPPPAAPAPGSAPAVPPEVLPDVPAGEADDSQQPALEEAPASSNLQPAKAVQPTNAPPPPVFPTAPAGTVKKRRVKPLQTTIGMDPTSPDFGAEGDLVSTINEGTAAVKPRRWLYTMHGFLQAPLRIGIGPSSPSVTNGMTSDAQLHSPAHVVGASIDDWNSVGLFPAAEGALYLSAGSAAVSGTLIISSGTFFDSGYRQLSEMGGVEQGYVTMKFNDAFGNVGGLAITAGAFSNRYGLAGPRQQSSGYYNTFLFGRTHVLGTAVTADVDLDEHAELIIEVGGGSKLEVVPWLNKPVATPYLPDQGPTPQGSNFVGHAHVALQMDDWFRLAAHFMSSYTPNDLQASTGGVPGMSPSAHMNVAGAEAHLDHARFGNGYLGYSHVSAENALALADGIEVIHAVNGTGLTRNYLNPGFTYSYPPIGSSVNAVPAGSVGDQGSVDTVMFQYMLRLAPLMDLPITGRDLALVVYGMYNHVSAPMLAGGKQDKLKFGSEAELAALRYLSIGLRFDRVMPNGGNADVAYTAISPRLILHTTWLSREYILVDYTHYFLGSMPQLMPTQYDPVVYAPDKNLFVVSALISF